jgi:D-alanyl-D-alanine carboxypeptidase
VLRQAAAQHHLPSLSVAIASRKGVVWMDAVGQSNLTTGRLADLNDYYGIGSITKTFVACLVERLIDEGVLREDERIAEVLPAELLDGIANADVATIGQLLDHSSGVPTWEEDPRWIRVGRGADQDPKHLWDKAETLQYIRGAAHPATHPAGHGYAYSNTNFTLLGLVLETVTGHSMTDLLHNQLLNPLGLMDIRLEGFEAVDATRLPARYHYNTAVFRRDAGISPFYRVQNAALLDVSQSTLGPEWTAGGLVATPRDLALFTVALRDGRVVSAEALSRMTQFKPTGQPDEEVGQGIFREQVAGGWLDGYDGGVLGFGAVTGWIEGEDIVISLATNVGMMHTGDDSFYPLQLVRSKPFMQALRRLAKSLSPPAG